MFPIQFFTFGAIAHVLFAIMHSPSEPFGESFFHGIRLGIHAAFFQGIFCPFAHVFAHEFFSLVTFTSGHSFRCIQRSCVPATAHFLPLLALAFFLFAISVGLGGVQPVIFPVHFPGNFAFAGCFGISEIGKAIFKFLQIFRRQHFGKPADQFLNLGVFILVCRNVHNFPGNGIAFVQIQNGLCCIDFRGFDARVTVLCTAEEVFENTHKLFYSFWFQVFGRICHDHIRACTSLFHDGNMIAPDIPHHEVIRRIIENTRREIRVILICAADFPARTIFDGLNANRVGEYHSIVHIGVIPYGVCRHGTDLILLLRIVGGYRVMHQHDRQAVEGVHRFLQFF